jgi:hypothetical protein
MTATQIDIKKISINTFDFCRSWAFHGGVYEECRLLGSGAAWIYYKPTFRRNVSLPSSGKRWLKISPRGVTSQNTAFFIFDFSSAKLFFQVMTYPARCFGQSIEMWHSLRIWRNRVKGHTVSHIIYLFIDYIIILYLNHITYELYHYCTVIWQLKG